MPMHTLFPRNSVLLTVMVLVVNGHGLCRSEVSLFERGVDLRVAGKHEEAVTAFRQVLARSPEHVGAMIHMGTALEDLGKSQEAVQWYRTALRFDPTNRAARTNLDHLVSSRTINRPQPGDDPVKSHLVQRGLRAAKDKDFDRALRCFRLVRGLYPGDPAWSFYSALIQERRGAHQRAAALYREVVNMVPGYAPAWVNSVVSLTELGDIAGALSQTRKALRILPGHPRLLYLKRILTAESKRAATEAVSLRIKRDAGP